MGYLLGFGIPITYLVVGLFFSRATYRSRYKRDLVGCSVNRVDTEGLCGTMVWTWPLLGPIYFLLVRFRGEKKTALHRFYTSNLPESDYEKKIRVAQEKWELRTRVRELEIANGMKPTETEREIGLKPYRY
jgi:hypothetical protein